LDRELAARDCDIRSGGVFAGRSWQFRRQGMSQPPRNMIPPGRVSLRGRCSSAGYPGREAQE